jgi:AAA domain
MENETKLLVVRASDLAPAPMEWLWAGRIPRGALTVLEGDPGEGKSTLALDIAARVTKGLPMPLSSATANPADVIILSFEDDVARTIRPRLEAAGGALDRAHIITGVPDAHGDRPFSLAEDVPKLIAKIKELKAAMVLIDPLSAALDTIDGNRDQAIRKVLTPLSMAAQETGAAIVVIRHLTKSSGRVIARGLGSIGISGAARAVLRAGPLEGKDKIISVVKCNLGGPQPAIRYRVEGTEASTIGWVGEVDIGSESEEPSAWLEAKQFLLAHLKDGPVPAVVIIKLAKAAGIATRTLQRAKADLGMASAQKAIEDGSTAWVWLQPSQA